ncbi:hypothetical protein RJT34_18078 [Clitoria ternatea]|uniref:Uncharacterized protein n=1 Tax=Clitoria ternatea TaxID=43366 RepID=A0AAN9PDW8_CLITE
MGMDVTFNRTFGMSIKLIATRINGSDRVFVLISNWPFGLEAGKYSLLGLNSLIHENLLHLPFLAMSLICGTW